MKKSLTSGLRATVLLFTFIIISITAPVTQAALPCNEIIYLYGESEPIGNCDDPFQVSEEESPFTISYADETISDGETVETDDLSATNLEITGSPRNTVEFHQLYRHDGDNYVEVNPNQDFEYATYTLVTNDEWLVVTDSSLLEKVFSFFIKTAHAQSFESYRYAITFTLSEPEPVEPEIDPLLLEYAPILYLHEDEDYFPMDVETFIEDSALWDSSGSDTQLHDSNTLTVELFNDITENENTENYYLAYSDPDNAGSLDLTAAKEKYGEPDEDNVTVYVHRMNDSFVDTFGQEHEYIVLQYWFFYAMNNWAEHGGFNNHEGDWESVFVFLDADTEEPEYVAYSSHHNDGDPEIFNFLQYDSVRREWNSDEVTKDNSRIISFVSLGSHANYPSNGGGNHPVRFPILSDPIDQTSVDGNHLESNSHLVTVTENGWFTYEGLWGTYTNNLGENGPQGPNYIEVSNHLRLHNPIEWAGIDKIAKTETSVPTSIIDFLTQGLSMIFSQPVPANTTFSVSPHDEIITFGTTPEDTTMLPIFWDIESSLENESFSSEVTFSYDPVTVENMDAEEENLSVFFYNPDTNTWEAQTSAVDTTENTVSFTTNHLSRYALGLVEKKEEPTPEQCEKPKKKKDHHHKSHLKKQICDKPNSSKHWKKDKKKGHHNKNKISRNKDKDKNYHKRNR